MRRLLAPVLIASLATLGLVGCSSTSPAADCVRADGGDTAALDRFSVSEAGVWPAEIDGDLPVHASETTWTDEVAGDGPALTSTDQLALLDITLIDGSTGNMVGQTSGDDDLARAMPVAQWEQTIPAIGDALECAREGSRVVAVFSPSGMNPDAAAQLGLGTTSSAIAVIDVRKVYLPKADGADQIITQSGLPTVVRAEDGRPGVVIPSSPAPTELQVAVLKKGDGPEVTGDAPVRVAYTGLTWDEREVFDSTWESGTPASFDLSSVVPGFEEALKGQRVGSQILAVIPPEMGYGEEGQGSIPGNATLVFVIDILGVDTLD